jgi:glycosyltransferase involved in cell wall biosynthesis
MQKTGKKKVLIMIDWFWPGYKAGGPISAAVNFVHYLQHDYELYIFTTDRDLHETEPYTGIVTDTWVSYEQAKVYYCSPAHLGYKQVKTVIGTIQPHYIYLHSLFSKYFTIYPLLLGRQRAFNAAIVLAPRGMLKSSALQFKVFKKKLFLQAFKMLGLHKHVFFQATDTTELNDIQKHFGNVSVTLAPDFPEFVKGYPGSTKKERHDIRIIFVGRIHPIKQPDFLIQLLPQLTGSVLLTIVGNEEDQLYANKCRQLSDALPANVQVIFKGGIPNKDLPAAFAQHHIFALPTRGENFGHAIFEALANGKPVLISDQTPWRQLPEHHAGWDLPLHAQASFVQALANVSAMDQQEYNTWSKGAWEFARHFTEQSDITTTYKNLFN